MRLIQLSLVVVPAVLFGASCEKKSAPEKVVDKVENKVKDATDSRPGEGIRDAAEDVKDAVTK